MRCHPTRWLWGLIPIAMLSWLAVHVESDRIERDLEQRSSAALAVAGFDWASVAFSGRDGLLVGRPVSARERDDAAALVGNIWGVRTVETRVAMSPAAAGLPIASVAADVAPRNIGDVAPSPLGVAAAADLALGRADIDDLASDRAPAMTVRARDHAEPVQPATGPAAPIPEQKAAVAANVPSHAEASPPPAPDQKAAVTVNVPPHAETGQPAAAPAAPIPEQKPVGAVKAPSLAEASPPPAPEQKAVVAVNAPPHAETAQPAAEPAAPIPVRKPAQAAQTPSSGCAGDAGCDARAAASAAGATL